MRLPSKLLGSPLWAVVELCFDLPLVLPYEEKVDFAYSSPRNEFSAYIVLSYMVYLFILIDAWGLINNAFKSMCI